MSATGPATTDGAGEFLDQPGISATAFCLRTLSESLARPHSRTLCGHFLWKELTIQSPSANDWQWGWKVGVPSFPDEIPCLDPPP